MRKFGYNRVGEACEEVARKYGILDKLERFYEVCEEYESLAHELSEYGFNTPDLYIAPFGHTTSRRGKEYVNEAFEKSEREAVACQNRN